MNNNHLPSFKALAIILFLGSLSGCGYFPGAYTLPIDQGNALSDDQISRLQVGMSENQVRFLLGSPVLKTTYHPDSWHYTFYATENHKLKSKRDLVVYFKDGIVERFNDNLIAETK